MFCLSRHHKNTARHQGVALVTVLLIVFLASMAAISLVSLQQRAIRRTTILDHQQQARLETLGAEEAAIILLIRDLQSGNRSIVGLDWTDMPVTLPIEGGTLTVRIRDRQGCFNLNNLWQLPQSGDVPTLGRSPDQKSEKEADPVEPKKPSAQKDKEKSADSGKSKPKPQLNKAQIKWLERILDRLELKTELAMAIADWIDPDSETLFPGGAEDSEYGNLDPPYRAANTFLMSISELRLIQGINREAYDKLAPHVCALPNGVGMNINTANHFLLSTLGNDLKTEDLDRLLEDRPEGGYKEVDEFLNATKITIDAAVKSTLTTESQHLWLHAVAELGDGRAVLHSHLLLEGEEVRVLQRGFGDLQ